MMGKKKRKYVLAVLLLFIFLVIGCTKNISNEKNYIHKEVTVTDSIGRIVKIPSHVEKVVVFNRYNVEAIQSLGAIKKIAGIDYGVYLDKEAYGREFNENQVSGKNANELNYEKIIELAPQVVIITGNGAWEDAQKKLEPFGIKVVVVNAYYTDQFQKTYRLLGKVLNKEEEAEEFIAYFEDKLAYIDKKLKGVHRKKVYYEYKNPGTTTIPGDYFYNMLEVARADNIFSDAKNVKISLESVIFRNPDLIVKVGEAKYDPKYLPPGDAEFENRKKNIINRVGFEQITAVKNDEILLISQYAQGGASKIIGACYIAKFLYPEYLPELHPEEIFKTWVTKYQKLTYVGGHTYPKFSVED